MQSALQLPALEAALHGFASGTILHWLTLGSVLLGTLAVGICAHELLHLVPLSFVDASYTVTVLPSDESMTSGDSEEPTPLAGLRSGLKSGLVRVEVTHVPERTPDWLLRVAALLPVVLALPLVLVAAGVVPDPLSTGDHVTTVVLVALTGCGLPSPADWSVVWHGTDLSGD